MALEAVRSSRQEVNDRHLWFALAFSIAAHGLILTLYKPSPEPPPERTIEIEVLSPPKEPIPEVKRPPPQREAPQQIVSPSESSKTEPKQPTRFKSEHDSETLKETIKRGDPLAGVEPGPLQRQQQAVAKSVPQTKQIAKQQPESEPLPVKTRKSKSEPTLKLDDSQMADLLEDERAPVKEKSGKAVDRERAKKLAMAQPFRRSNAGSLFKGNYGSSDYLPDIQDGDITLLNAKADRFAVFVRRVALQVFGALRKLNWQELSRSEINKMNEFSSIHAIMNPAGKLVSVSIESASGSTRFDSIAKKAAELGTWDQNPPKEAAAEDKNIHFVFKAKSWSRVGPNGMNEQRWLMLGTGLL